MRGTTLTLKTLPSRSTLNGMTRPSLRTTFHTTLSFTDFSRPGFHLGTIGWVASRFLSQSQSASNQIPKKGTSCNTDFAFVKTPKPSFAEGATKHGLVVIDAYVSPAGEVTSTKVISNETGDEALASMAALEIKSAKFEAPKRNCSAKAFIFTYKRSF